MRLCLHLAKSCILSHESIFEEVGVLKARIKGALEWVKCHCSDLLYKENELNLLSND